MKGSVTKRRFLGFSLLLLAALVPPFCAFAADLVCSREHKNTALVIIDMQDLFRTRGGNGDDPSNVAKTNTLVQNQQEAIRKAMNGNAWIIYFVYADYGGPTIPQLTSLTASYSRVVTFKKSTDGAFDTDNQYRGDLVRFMKENQIGNLVIMGANGGACVHSTIRGALSGNCNVESIATGIADFNYKAFVFPYLPEQYAGIQAKDLCPNCGFSTKVAIQEVDLSFREANGLLAGGRQ